MANQTLSQKTADQLRESILTNHVYMPGQKLPNENQLSIQMGISRTTLREAIRILVSEGLLRVERGNGTFVVNQGDIKTDPQLDIQEVQSMKVTLHDLFETRLMIEPQAAELACQRATNEEIEHILKLGETVQHLILLDPTAQERISSETEFHSSIIRAAHNEFLNNFIMVVKETIEKTFEFHANLELIAQDAYADHILIMEFLKHRDGPALRSAVLIHLHHTLIREEISVEKANL